MAHYAILASEEVQKKRMEICKKCDYYNPISTRCKSCGCFLVVKTKLAAVHCPEGYWLAEKLPE